MAAAVNVDSFLEGFLRKQLMKLLTFKTFFLTTQRIISLTLSPREKANKE